MVTAIGVMSAVDTGLLDLDTPIRDAIVDLSLLGDESDRLSLRQLLSQQTGLRDYVTLPGPAADAGLAAFTSGPELAENVDFMIPPGLFWNYSNPNFTIAGRALEAARHRGVRDRWKTSHPMHMRTPGRARPVSASRTCSTGRD